MYRRHSLEIVSRGGDDDSSERLTHTHVCEEKAPIGLGLDIVCNGRQKSSITLQELWLVDVADVEVKSSVLGLQQREETTSPKVLAICRGSW